MSAVLIINRNESKCLSCGKGADPRSKTHDKVLSWGFGEDGCGVEYTHVSSEYVGLNMESRIQEMRPDLEWVSLDKAYKV